MARLEGDLKVGANIEIRTSKPIDARSVINTSADRLLEATWVSGDGLTYLYNGMVVTAADTGAQYVLLDKDNYTNPNSWKQADASAAKVTVASNDKILSSTDNVLSAVVGLKYANKQITLVGKNDTPLSTPISVSEFVKDNVVSGAVLVTKLSDDPSLESGATRPAYPYIKLSFNTSEGSNPTPIRFSVKDLIDIYTGNAPIVVEDNVIKLNTGKGLTTEANTLVVNADSTKGLTFEDGKLKVALGTCLDYGDSGDIFLNVDNTSGLIVDHPADSPYGKLGINGDAIKVTNPTDNSTNTLKATLKSIKDFAVESTSLTGSNTIEIADNSVSVKIGSGLTTGKGLTVNAGNGITVDGDVSVNPNTNKGIGVTTLGVEVKLKEKSSLYFNSGAIDLKLGSGLTRESLTDSVVAKVDQGLILTSAGNIGINYGSGLKIENNKLVADTSAIVSWEEF